MSTPNTGAGNGSGAAGGANGNAGGGAGGSGAGTGGNPGSGAPSWTTGLGADELGIIEVKGWKSAQDVIKSYTSLEKNFGAPADQILRLPKEDDADGWNKVYGRLGRPEKADDYKLPKPAEGTQADAEFETWAKGKFHELGISNKQAEKLVAGWNDYVKAGVGKQTEAQQNVAREQEGALQKEWGQAFEQNKKIGSAAVSKFGIDGATIDKIESALGYADTMRLFHKLGVGIGEDNFIQNGGGSGGNNQTFSPNGAQARINELRNDNDFVQKLSSGNAEALKEWDRLHRMLNG
jgi:hypothetical protein